MHVGGIRADANIPGEVQAGPEGTGEVRGSSDAGERGTSIENIGGGPSWAGKPAWLQQDLLESVSSLRNQNEG
jgi:hypothetical protein